MRTVSSSLTSESQKETLAPITLLTAYLTNSTYRLCDQEVPVYSSGVKFESFPFKTGKVDTGLEKGTSGLTVALSNVEYTVSRILNSDDIRGKRIVVQKVIRPYIDEPLTEFDGYVNNVDDLNEDMAVLNCVSRLKGVYSNIPRNYYTSLCRWNYEVEYPCHVGSGTFNNSYSNCDRTYTDCQSRENTARFGGFFV